MRLTHAYDDDRFTDDDNDDRSTDDDGAADNSSPDHDATGPSYDGGPNFSLFAYDGRRQLLRAG